MRRTDSRHRTPRPIILDGVLHKLYGLQLLGPDDQHTAVHSKLVQLLNQRGEYTDGMLQPETMTHEALTKFLGDASLQLLRAKPEYRRVAQYERDSRNNVWLLRDTYEICGLF